MKESDYVIGVFDSGIGGVTVLKEILKVLPNYKYIYYSDSFNNPYGDKSVEELCILTKNIVQFLIDKGCKIIVIACNTASAICKDYLREVFDEPIIAIEPAIKSISNLEGKTLVMATKGTVTSKKFLESYEKFDNNNMVVKTFSGLADLIEDNRLEEIRKYLQENLNYKGIKNVVLGCTHYPLVKDYIKEVLGDVNFFDGSVGVAKRVKQVTHDIALDSSAFSLEFVDSSGKLTKEKRFYELLDL